MPIGPTQRDQNGIVQRADGLPHPGSVRAQIDPRDTPYYLRITKAEFQRLEALITELGHTRRHAFVKEAMTVLGIMIKAVPKSDSRDRAELLTRSIEALAFLEKRSPIPAWAQLEAPVPLQALPAPRSDQSTT